MDNRDEGGKFNQEYSDEEFLSAIENLPVAGTQKVADEVGCSYNLAYRRLKNLYESGHVEYENVGSAFVWTINK